MRVLIATNNPAKVDRVRAQAPDHEFVTPADLGLPSLEVEEGSDIRRNAEMKALAYRELTDLPILGLDSAFVIPGINLDPAKVKRNALEGKDEASMTREEVAEAIVAFYRCLVVVNGGPMPAYWEDASVLVMPNSETRAVTCRRPVILTGEVQGKLNPAFPLRSMYIVEPTRKYVCDQTVEDERLELAPYREALERLLG